MSSIKERPDHRCFCFIVFGLLLVSQSNVTAQEQKIDTPFSVSEIIEKVSRNIKIDMPINSVFSRAGEFLIDTSVVYVPAPGSHGTPSIVFDGTNYLVMWDDSRSGSSDIYAARVTPGGVVLDPTGIPVCTAANNQWTSAVAFDGTNYFAVWDDSRSGTSDIYGARVSTGGTVLDPAGIAISTATSGQSAPSVAFGGANYLVAWGDARNGGSDVYAARVTTAGTVLDPSGFAISTAANNQSTPSVAFNDTFFVAWRDTRGGGSDIYGARVTTAGAVLDPSGIAVSTAANNQITPSVCFGGVNYLVAWGDARNGGSDIYAARVTTAGSVLDSSGIAISTASQLQLSPSVGFDGTNYFVVWEDLRNSASSDIYGARVSTSGSVLDPSGIVISAVAANKYSPSVAFSGATYLTVWEDYRSGALSAVYGTRVTTAGSVLDPSGIAITISANPQEYPSAAFDGANYLVVWRDSRSDTTFDIYAARVTTAGALLDPVAIAVSTAANDQYSPSVAFDGANYLVVWDDARSGTSADIYAARVTTAGTVLDPAGIAVSTATDDQYSPCVAFDGFNYLVAWEDQRSGTPDIYAARVTTGGAVLDPAGIAISTVADSQGSPSITFDGSNCLVVWDDTRSGGADIYGARVTTEGTVLDPAGIAISIAANNQWISSVAFGDTTYLVAWQDIRSGAPDIYGARVTIDGLLLDANGIVISAAADSQRFPSMAYDGINYLVVWDDTRSGSTRDIYGACVSTAGSVIDEFAVSVQQGDQVTPAVSHGTGGQLLITYSGFADSVCNHPANAMRIWGKFYPFTGIVEDETETVKKHSHGIGATVIAGSLRLPAGMSYRVFDIAGREVKPHLLTPGIYFIEIDGEIAQKVIKIR